MCPAGDNHPNTQIFSLIRLPANYIRCPASCKTSLCNSLVIECPAKHSSCPATYKSVYMYSELVITCASLTNSHAPPDVITRDVIECPAKYSSCPMPYMYSVLVITCVSLTLSIFHEAIFHHPLNALPSISQVVQSRNPVIGQ
jgi:hypothetical protein